MTVVVVKLPRASRAPGRARRDLVRESASGRSEVQEMRSVGRISRTYVARRRRATTIGRARDDDWTRLDDWTIRA